MPVIEITDLCKSYGTKLAVDGVSFMVRPGEVTAFVGPNGAGKSTVLRIALGLDAPDRGSALIQGRLYRLLDAPARRVGALLDASAMHPAQTGRMHLRVLAQAAGLPPERVDRVLAQVGLESAAGSRVRTYSLGMRQRLGIAAALLGEPDVLILDEPTNGLDPEGIRWFQHLLRSSAAAGLAVLISSHHMSELEQTADRVVVIAAGRIVADARLSELVYGPGAPTMRVETLDVAALRAAVAAAGGSSVPAQGAAGTGRVADELKPTAGAATIDGDGDAGGSAAFVDVQGLSRAALAELFLQARIRVLSLAPLRTSLQDVYARLTTDLEQYRFGGELPQEPDVWQDGGYVARLPRQLGGVGECLKGRIR
ncbi:MAG TPA: ATP-binding cassette domain-containing protein [Actinocrinis sp.]|nr:ATP-binding cassette domain-containing protein [Actinocrinis sp.]